jgi:DnaJ-domain-containing protein 1
MPVLSKNFFALFGLEPKLRLDLEALQKRFHELSRNRHPDRSHASERKNRRRRVQAPRS